MFHAKHGPRERGTSGNGAYVLQCEYVWVVPVMAMVATPPAVRETPVARP
jgi:hypothetical protein